MTILIGILCRDGVVIGSDTSATSVDGQTPTIEQPTHKIEIVSNRMIVACSGPLGLAQRFTAIVEKASENKLFAKGKQPLEVGKELCGRALQDFASTGLAAPFDFGALIAFPIGSGLNLCEFETIRFQPELKGGGSLWYVAMGSGQAICDPFLGLQRRVFWKDGRPPTLMDGIFATVWTLQHVVDLNPGGIKGPIEVAVLDNSKHGADARLLGERELDEHRNNIVGLEEHISKYPELLSGDLDTEVPEVEKPKPPVLRRDTEMGPDDHEKCENKQA